MMADTERHPEASLTASQGAAPQSMIPNAAQLVLLQLAAEGALSEYHVVKANEAEYRVFGECLKAGWIAADSDRRIYHLTGAGLLAIEAGYAR